ncbi:MAG TPA: hypothetical protein PLR26_03800 [Bacilli bacterium]|nr:hypothetical protein [Bacilli bacterium]
MKKIFYVIIAMVLLAIGISNNLTLASEETPQAVYFYSPTCSTCAQWGPYMDQIIELGVNLEKVSTMTQEGYRLFEDYKLTYLVPRNEGTVPLLFVGDEFYGFEDFDTVKQLISSQEIIALANTPLKPLQSSNPQTIAGFVGFLYVVFSGLLDGFNPCAIAMLLLFISLLGFSKDKKILIGVSISYIAALFLTYFALGTFLFQFLHLFNFASLTIFLNIFILVLCSILFLFNLYDFFMSRKNRFDKIKNQLPKGLKRFNQNIIRTFTKKMKEGSIAVYFLAFLLGVIISFTEFLCTGQVYLPVIISLIQFSEDFQLGAYLYLIVYNFMFVLPLIVITVFAVKSKSVMAASEKIREKMYLIKLINALLFLAIVIYYIFKLV